MKNAIFTVKVEREKSPHWAVYSLHDTDGVVQFLGVTQFKSLMSIPDARKHPMFLKIFGASEEITGQVQQVAQTKQECIVWVNRYLEQNPRPFMMQYRTSRSGRVAVKCLETGEAFESITECADAHGLSQSALSNHLNGNSSYLTVGGRTYEHLTQI